MVRIIKMALVCCVLFISFCEVSSLQAAESLVLRKRHRKKTQETIIFERVGRTMDKWERDMEDLYDDNHTKAFEMMVGYINLLELWKADPLAFWVIGREVRACLTEWMEAIPTDYEVSNVALIKKYVETIYRLDRILEKQNSLLFGAMFVKDEEQYEDALLEQHPFSKETLQIVIKL